MSRALIVSFLMNSYPSLNDLNDMPLLSVDIIENFYEHRYIQNIFHIAR